MDLPLHSRSENIFKQKNRECPTGRSTPGGRKERCGPIHAIEGYNLKYAAEFSEVRSDKTGERCLQDHVANSVTDDCPQRGLTISMVSIQKNY